MMGTPFKCNIGRKPELLLESSCRLVNALPKLWGGKGGSATSEQLRNKQQRHNMLLQVLQAASLLDHLPAGVLRILFENGEKIAALTGLRELENRLLAERAHNELLPVQQAIGQAGADVKPEVGRHRP